MILVHLSVNGKPAILDPESIVFAEECDGKDKDEKEVSFTRIYLKQQIKTMDGELNILDVKETVEKILKAIK